MASNSNLHKANVAKKDEFYTQLEDIEKEMCHYKDYFKNKVILCNCDDPYESNFFKYFAMNFKHLEIKKLITTCYVNSSIQGELLPLSKVKEINYSTNVKHPYKVELTQKDMDGVIGLQDVENLLKDKNNVTLLNGDGDFRSEECIELLKQSDIVVTNPPFSLFREYVEQLVKYDKKFIILGGVNAITYKDIFRLIKGNKMWLGYCNNRDKKFIVPENYEHEEIIEGKPIKTVGAIWYTNLNTNKRNESLTLYKKYNTKEYPQYDNYNAINVDKVSDIPIDYDGAIGVPITFLDKYNPEQFELLGIMNTGEENKGIRYEGTPHGRPIINGVEKYLRILIREIKQNED
jgi:hypothetical protein